MDAVAGGAALVASGPLPQLSHRGRVRGSVTPARGITGARGTTAALPAGAGLPAAAEADQHAAGLQQRRAVLALQALREDLDEVRRERGLRLQQPDDLELVLAQRRAWTFGRSAASSRSAWKSARCSALLRGGRRRRAETPVLTPPPMHAVAQHRRRRAFTGRAGTATSIKLRHGGEKT